MKTYLTALSDILISWTKKNPAIACMIALFLDWALIGLLQSFAQTYEIAAFACIVLAVGWLAFFFGAISLEPEHFSN